MTDNTMTFANAYEELQQLAREFEANNLDLEQAIPKFKRAAQLSKFLKQKLTELENQIEEINLDLEKEAQIEPKPELPENSEDIPF